MTEQEKYVQECMTILRETLGTLMENASADDRYALLTGTRDLVREYIDELDED